MPVELPTAEDLGARPIPQPAPVPRVGIDPEAAGAGLDSLGRSLSSAGDDIFDVQKQLAVAKQHADKTRAEDADTQAKSLAIDLAQGQDGYSNLHGADVVNKPVLDSYLNKYDLGVAKISEGLANDQQRAMFKLRAGVTRLQMQQDLLRHIGHESAAYNKSVFEDGVAMEQRTAGLHWMNQPDVALSVARIQNLVRQRASDLGLPDDAAKELFADAVSGVHREVINQALAAQNYKAASDYFGKFSPEMNEQDRKAVQAPMQLGAAAYTADTIVGRYGTGPRAITEANKIADPVLRTHVMDAIEHRSAVLDHARAEEERAVRESTSAKLEASDSTTPVEQVFTPTELTQIARVPGLMESLQQRQIRRASGEQPITDRRVYEYLDDLAVNNPQKFIDDGLDPYRDKLDDKAFEHFATLQRQLKSGEVKASGLQTIKNIRDQFVGEVTGTKPGQEDDPRANALRDRFDQAVQADRDQGIKVDSNRAQEIKKQIVRDVVLSPGITLGGVSVPFTGTTKREYEMTLGDVPQADQDAIRRVLRERGITQSEQAIVDVYARYLEHKRQIEDAR